MIHAIVNAKARVGNKKSAAELVEKTLREKGEQYRIYRAENSGETKQLCDELSAAEGPKTIWVVGGDGTVNEAINGLHVNDDLRFAYLPAGSGNDLARGLGLPQDLEKAMKQVLSADGDKLFDYGEMELFPGGVTHFAGSSGMGYDASVCAEIETSKIKKRLNKLHLGKLAYYLVAIKQVFANPRFNMTLIADGGTSRSYSDCIFICMMNHRYQGGGLKMAPTADPCDGKITVTFAHNMSRLRVLLALPRIVNGSYIKLKTVETFDCRELEVITDSKQYVHNDGEVVGELRHLKVRCGEGKLHMPV